MAKWEEIKREYETSKITLAKLAEKHGIPLGTIKSQKSRDTKNGNPWVRDGTKKDATKSKKVATQKQIDATTENTQQSAVKSKRYPNGHPGNPNPTNKFTERNQAALKHGLFSRYIPKETMEIMGMVANGDEESILWMQIQIQFAAIIRAQDIMHVSSKDELVKELKKHKQGESGEEKEYEIQFAWDRYERYLKAQTRAIGELRASIKQYLELPFIDEMKREQLKLITEQVTKLAKENTPNTSTEDKLQDYFKALQGAFKDDNSDTES